MGLNPFFLFFPFLEDRGLASRFVFYYNGAD